MPTTEIDLGHADLQSRKTDICVELRSSARFAASEEDGIAELRQELTAARLTDQSGRKPWIRRGDAFKLVLSLHLDAVLGAPEQDETVPILSDHLQRAKVDALLIESRYLN